MEMKLNIPKYSVPFKLKILFSENTAVYLYSKLLYCMHIIYPCHLISALSYL